MYRLSKSCFEHLCKQIKVVVSEEEFKSESFCDLVNKTCDHPHLKGHEKRNSGIISGELKVALTLWLLAGGSYLDLSLLYGVSYQYLYQIFHYVNKEWFCNNKVTSINLHDQLGNIDSMKRTANKFANGSSNGYLNGYIGAIDGWLVCIKRPSKIILGV